MNTEVLITILRQDKEIIYQPTGGSVEAMGEERTKELIIALEQGAILYRAMLERRVK